MNVNVVWRPLMEKMLPQVESKNFKINLKDLPGSTLKEVRVRNNNFWAILNNGSLIYVDFSRLIPKTTYLNVEKCKYLFVSPDGDYCFVRTDIKKQHYFITANSLEPKIAKLIPGTEVRSCAWLYGNGQNNKPRPLLFMGTEMGQILYFDLNTPMISCAILPIVSHDGSPILGMSFNVINDLTLKKKFITACIVYKDMIVPHLLSAEDYLEVDEMKKRTTTYNLPGLKKSSGAIFSENHLFGAITEMFQFKFNMYTDKKPSPRQILDNQIALPIEKGAIGSSLYSDFTLQYFNEKVVFFLDGTDNPVFELQVPQNYMFDFDTVTASLYGFDGNKIIRYTFGRNISLTDSPSGAFRYWMYRHLVQVHQEDEAAKVLLNNEMPFDSVLAIVRKESDELRLRLYKELIANLKDSFALQKATLVITAFDLYVRLESEKEEPNVKEFCDWANNYVRVNHYINDQTLQKICAEYGWEEPLGQLSKSIDSLNLRMENNDYEAAIQILPSISEISDFKNATLRLYKTQPETIANAVKARSDTIIPQFIPILLSPYCKDFVLRLVDSRSLSSSWIRSVFVTHLATVDDEERMEDLIFKFFPDVYLTPNDIQFATRTLLEAKKYMSLATGFQERKEYENAVKIASLGDPEKSFQFIPTDASAELKKRCSTRILRSMNKTEAANLARNLLGTYSGIHIATVLGFLPEDIKVAELSDAIARYSSQNSQIYAQQQVEYNQAINGINQSLQLIADKEAKVFRFPSMTSCSKCGKALLTEEGVVYPCDHAFHYDCAHELCKSVNKDAPERDCPICGFTCVQMIDEPFDEVSPSQDPWTLDRDILNRMSFEKESHFGLNFLSNFDF